MLETLEIVIELKAIMFKSFHVWVAAHGNFCFSNFLEFLDL
jgi:hypothetical protein